MLFICLLCFCSFSFGLVELDQVNVVGGVPYQPDCSLMLIQASVSLTSGVRGVLGGACVVFAEAFGSHASPRMVFAEAFE